MGNASVEDRPMPPEEKATSPWLIACGVLFMILWALIHAALFYALAAGGIVSEILLTILRSVLLPGTADTPASDNFVWLPALKACLILTGFSGLPAGFAFFLKRKRKILLLSSVITFLLGLLVAFLSILALLSNGLKWFFT